MHPFIKYLKENDEARQTLRKALGAKLDITRIEISRTNRLFSDRIAKLDKEYALLRELYTQVLKLNEPEN